MPADMEPAPEIAASPARIVTDAINAAVDRGLTIRSKPDLGVHCTSTHAPCWEPDPRAPGVSVLGAVLLAKQPQVTSPVKGLILALGVTAKWLEGFDDGCDGAREAPQMTIDAGMYADGYVLGCETRQHLHRLGKGLRQLVQVAPGLLIDQLLESMTSSQVLLKQATIERKRAKKFPIARELHEEAAEMMETLARHFQVDGL